ncbi:aa3-type cytochrome c oxidase subunit IV [Methylocapsa sp. S129]|uniref:aa3-type cytochrome c oxidase subunit IV n=1 Tax=Methylocapsa sp. S129 TaxID=1641869 RepID=UPI00131B0583|nr:aa3-type cytochrome c oxidase subunit IV [Methylocapsa sp. S129]
MADDHSAATADNGMDMPAHEATYAAFIALTETSVVTLICIVLELVLWGLKGQGAIALIGFVLTIGAATFGSMSGLTWRAVLPVLVLLGLACIVL